jgi:MFS family permease
LRSTAGRGRWRHGHRPAPSTARRDRRVIAAASLGTVFEWYDFYLYGLLATIISSQFFSGVNETTGFIFALAAFAAGFAVRPFGALVFGRIGDLVGRKYTFLVTMAIMGLSTFLVGLLPSYATAGVAARSRWWSFACSKASRSAANMAERRPMSPSTRPTANAASTPASSRPPRRWACSPPCWW